MNDNKIILSAEDKDGIEWYMRVGDGSYQCDPVVTAHLEAGETRSFVNFRLTRRMIDKLFELNADMAEHGDEAAEIIICTKDKEGRPCCDDGGLKAVADGGQAIIVGPGDGDVVWSIATVSEFTADESQFDMTLEEFARLMDELAKLEHLEVGHA